MWPPDVDREHVAAPLRAMLASRPVRERVVAHLGPTNSGKTLTWDPEKREFTNDEIANRMRSRAMRENNGVDLPVDEIYRGIVGGVRASYERHLVVMPGAPEAIAALAVADVLPGDRRTPAAARTRRYAAPSRIATGNRCRPRAAGRGS